MRHSTLQKKDRRGFYLCRQGRWEKILAQEDSQDGPTEIVYHRNITIFQKTLIRFTNLFEKSGISFNFERFIEDHLIAKLFESV